MDLVGCSNKVGHNNVKVLINHL